jgi:drug/metabolite transporter (DMT)-like permease
VSGAPARAALPRLAVLAAAVLFSTGGAAIKGTTLSGIQVASLRSAVAVVFILAYLAARRRPLPRPTRATWPVAATYAVTLTLFVTSNKLTTAAAAIFLQSTAPLYVLLLGPWLLAEPVRRRDVGYMAFLALGMGLFFYGLDPASTMAPDPRTGNILAAAAGLTWALTVMGLRFLGRTSGGGEGDLGAVVYGALLACALLLPWALPASPTASDLLIVGYLGVFQIGVAYLFLTAGMRRVSAFEGSLLLLLEPVLNPLWAWLVHGEVPGPWSLWGGGVILASTVAKSWLDGRGGERPRGTALSEVQPPP